MATLTKKQAEVLAYIRQHVEDHGYAPSYREIAEHFNLSSPATIHQYVKTLTEKGYLSNAEDGSARSLEVLKPEKTFPFAIELPLVGLITGPS